MKVITDFSKVSEAFIAQKKYFLTKPGTMRLLVFEKGELLYSPLSPLKEFLLIIEGSASIYDVSECGSIHYLTKAFKGTLLGDLEFSEPDAKPFFTEALEELVCLSIPFEENRRQLENDAVFLRFMLSQLAKKLARSVVIDATTQTLEERLLLFLEKIKPDHRITSVNDSFQFLHCSRRQLQRILKKLCDKNVLKKEKQGCYSLTAPKL